LIPIGQVPFAYHEDQWVGFDDERSLRTKVDWLKTEGFGGIMVWSVDLDDFRGYCGTGKFPLLKSMTKELEGHQVRLTYKGPYDTKENEQIKEKALCNDDEGQVSCVDFGNRVTSLGEYLLTGRIFAIWANLRCLGGRLLRTIV
jgi:chitinase